MKRLSIVLTVLIFSFSGNTLLYAHSNGATSIHEISKAAAPTVSLEITKDPTGGFNVHVDTTNFIWRPEMASMKHVPGEGHAHVFLDGRKIMRIYNDWFHLNTYQFATRAGEQLLSVEFVGNDHVPYTIQGSPVGDTKIIDVLAEEIQPTESKTPIFLGGLAALALLFLANVFFRRKKSK